MSESKFHAGEKVPPNLLVIRQRENVGGWGIKRERRSGGRVSLITERRRELEGGEGRQMERRQTDENPEILRDSG